jgi:hypothetical protein
MLLPILAMLACSTEPPALLADVPVPVPVVVTVSVNPDNPFSRILDVSGPEGASIEVVHEMGTTPAQGPGEILVLGLAAGRTHSLDVMVDGELAETVEVVTDALSDGWPTCEAEGAFVEQEVVCTNGKIFTKPIYYCVDKAGTPVWSLRHPDDVTMLAVRSLPNGGYAAVGDTRSMIVIFDERGKLIAEYSHLWFPDRTRFDHHTIDMHDVIAITEGQWAGAIAFLTATTDIIDGEELLAPGIVVMDPETGEVLWDWLAHGTLGDGIPIDPSIDYQRRGLLGEDKDSFVHANALLHRVYPDGREAMWLSLRRQDWLMSINTETDLVNWRLGLGGDFDGTAHTWFYQQHAPEVRVHDGETRVLLFDNSAYRPNGGGQSRVIEIAIDEEAMTAEIRHEASGFFSFAMGDADLLHDGERLQYVVGWNTPTEIVEVSWPDGDELWHMTCDTKRMYRVDSFPSLYDRTWWYEVER